MKLHKLLEEQLPSSAFVTDIEQDTLSNQDFRNVLFTTQYSQLVLMNINPKSDIGVETHDGLDQFIRIEAGEGQLTTEGSTYDIQDGSAIVIPSGVKHNIRNTSDTDQLKIYTIYTPPHHEKGTVHSTKQEAMDDDEHFTGQTDLEDQDQTESDQEG